MIDAAVEPRRSHEYVAGAIRRHVALRLLPPDGRLPSQRELAVAFGVGRGTVERAVRLLEAEGLVESRRGRGGGRFARFPSPDRDLEELLGRVARSRRWVEEALVFRAELEPGAAAAAAERRSEDALAEIAACAEAAARIARDPEVTAADTAFHLAVARAAGSALFVEAVERVRLALRDALLALPDSPLWQRRSTAEHAAVLRAIAERRPEAARRAMRRHVRLTEQGVAALLAALDG